ncbi:MAG: hypothetical protein AAGE80_05555 [Pseudomonadota bacterium]
MNILALDISLRGCGAAMGDGSCPPHTTVASFAAVSHGKSGKLFRDWLRDTCLNSPPALIIYEAPFRHADKKSAQSITTLLTGLCFTCEVFAAEKNIRCTSVAISTWRKWFIGKGFPEQAKLEALNMCEFLGWETGGVHDRAEAAGIWAYAHLKEGNFRGVQKMLSKGSMKDFSA